jgi:hypothetical protein
MVVSDCLVPGGEMTLAGLLDAVLHEGDDMCPWTNDATSCNMKWNTVVLYESVSAREIAYRLAERSLALSEPSSREDGRVMSACSLP